MWGQDIEIPSWAAEQKKFVLKRRNAGENVTLNTAVSRACTVVGKIIIQ